MIEGDDIRGLILLRAISKLALLLYPFPDGSDIAKEKAFALGQIAAIASKAVRQHEEKDASNESRKEI